MCAIQVLLASAAAAALISSCVHDGSDGENTNYYYKYYKERVSVELQLPSAHSAQEFTIFQFDNEKLKSIAKSVAIKSDGTIDIDIDASNSGVVYIVSKGIEDFDDEFKSIGVTTRSEFEMWSVTHNYTIDGNSPETIFIKSLSVAQLAEVKQAVALDSSTANVNLKISDDIEVHSMEVNYISDIFYPFADAEEVDLSQDVTFTVDLEEDYSQTIYGIFKLFSGEYKKAICARVLVEHPNGTNIYLEVELPLQISGSKEYTIVVNSYGASLSTPLDTEDWDQGEGESEGYYNNVVVIDESSVTLPAGASISNGGKRLDLPYRGANFNLKFTNNDVIKSVSIMSDDITITSKGDNIYLLEANKAAPDGLTPSPSIISVVRMLDGLEYVDQIELYVDQNPINMYGSICDYHAGNWQYVVDSHIDGNFANFTLPDGYSIEWDSGDWFQAQTDGDTTSFVGGWRPNDADAKGQVESITVNITTPTGIVDSYTLSRRRYSIPTIYFNDRYWAKFNMRGNPESYTDQIQVGSTYDKIVDIYEYLKSCSTTAFLDIAGDAYLGGNTTTALKFGKNPDGDGFGYTQYSSVSDRNTIATMDAGHSCPNGYTRPTGDEYRSIIWDQATFGTSTFADSNELTHATVTTQYGSHRVTLTAYRNDNFAYQGGVGTVMFMKVESQSCDDTFVIPCYGTQWSSTWSLTQKYGLFAMYAPGATSMFNNNYNNDEKLRIVHTGQAAVHTYQVRCIKSEDAFIIE